MSNLKQMRLLCNLSQKELAQRVKVSPPSVAKLEAKGIYDTRTAVKYAEALKCSPIFLLDWLGI